MTLRVLEAGLYSLIVDQGRPSSRSLGVPVGGAADRFALALGNALVGNPPAAPALEISLAGPTLQAACDLACVLFGAPFQLVSDRQTLAAGKTFTLHEGEVLRIGSTPAGARAYLCVRGGLDQPCVLGSRSALEPIRAGVMIPCAPGTIAARYLRLDLPREGRPHPVECLRVIDGPQSNWFESGPFFGEHRTVLPASNRMGLRLQGAPLRLPERELVSEPVCPGAVQATRDGQCIVLGVDGQTIGGYPKIAQVIAADLDRLGQLRSGDRVVFGRVTLEEAVALYRQRQALLREWLLRLRCQGPGF